jgi:uncharacterized membrane protein
LTPGSWGAAVNFRKIVVLSFVISTAAVVYVTAAAVFFGVHFAVFVTPLVTLLCFLFAALHSVDRFGWKLSLLLLGLTFIVSLTLESIGVATGKIYGPYHYTSLLGPKFLGLVPVLIPAAWFMMMYPSFLITTRLVPQQWQPGARLAGLAALGALVMTAWDLVMDPLMVAGRYWAWEVNGAYFGVPLQNYWGWWLTTFITFALFLLLGGPSLARQTTRSAQFDRLAVASYLIIGLSNIIYVFNWGISGPGLVGLFAMLPWGILGWKKAT